MPPSSRSHVLPKGVAPHTLAAWLSRARKFHASGKYKEAQVICQEVLTHVPAHFEALHMLGVVAYKTNNPAAAVDLITKAIAINPLSPFPYNSLALSLMELNRFEDAATNFTRAIEFKSGFAQAYSNRSLAMHALDRLEEAIDDCTRALLINPAYAEAYNNRGLALMAQKKYVAAIKDFDKAIEIQPRYEMAFFNRGLALHECHDHDAALASYEQALSINPHNARAYWNVALLALLMGDYSTGWELHEWRWKHEQFRATFRDFTQPLWLGKEALDGKTILLYAEQGLGDTLQFCRYALLVQALGAKVILEVQRPLVTLLKANFGDDVDVIEAGAALPAFDYHCPMMSLPLSFQTTLDTVPACQAYIRADQRKSAYWRGKLMAHTGKLKVGLVWRGGVTAHQPEMWGANERRNIPLAQLARLNCDHALFVSLQKGEPAESELLDQQAELWPSGNLLNFASKLNDFSDTAALVDNLDLVITVDTSTAHLAAAMGKPVWLLNRFDTCWRWLQHRDSSPWYPSVKLYRQKYMGDWDGVLQAVRNDLLALGAAQLGG